MASRLMWRALALGTLLFAPSATLAATWTEYPLPAPPGSTTEHATVYDPVRNRMVIHGGMTTFNMYSETYALDLSGLDPSWSLLADGGDPLRRHEMAAIYDPVRDRMVIFGGSPVASPGSSASHYLSDLWTLSMTPGSAWAAYLPANAGPGARIGSRAIYDPVRDRMIVFGGMSPGLVCHNDVWALRFSDDMWEPLAPGGGSPTPRKYASLIYEPVGDRALMFGGQESSGAGRNDTWELTLGGSPQWTQLYALGFLPPPRSKHIAVYDPLRHRMLTYGGPNTSTLVAALSLNGPLTWKHLNADGDTPLIRYGLGGVYDPALDRLVIFGGVSSPPGDNDVSSLALGGVADAGDAAPSPAFALEGATPNPSRRTLTIAFSLPDAAPARLDVFDIAGKRIASRDVGAMGAGRHQVDLTREMPRATGLYFARIQRAGQALTRRFVLQR